MTPTPVIAHCPCGLLDRPPCTRVGGAGECATTAPLRFVWTVSLGVEADTPGVRTPTCQRTGCDATNPRTLTAAAPATYEDAVTAISRTRRADQRGDVFETAGGNRRIVNPDWPSGDEPLCEPADGESATCGDDDGS